MQRGSVLIVLTFLLDLTLTPHPSPLTPHPSPTHQLVEYTIKRNLLQAEGRSVAETPAWRARFDPKQKKYVP